MVFLELNRISKSDRQPLPKNPYAKLEPRRLRRAKARQIRSEARSLGAAANQSIRSSQRGNSI